IDFKQVVVALEDSAVGSNVQAPNQILKAIEFRGQARRANHADQRPACEAALELLVIKFQAANSGREHLVLVPFAGNQEHAVLAAARPAPMRENCVIPYSGNPEIIEQPGANCGLWQTVQPRHKVRPRQGAASGCGENDHTAPPSSTSRKTTPVPRGQKE